MNHEFFSGQSLKKRIILLIMGALLSTGLILSDFMGLYSTPVYADSVPVLLSVSLEGPERLFIGQSYDFVVTFVYDRNVENEQFYVQTRYSFGFPDGIPFDVANCPFSFNGNIYTRSFRVNVSSNAVDAADCFYVNFVGETLTGEPMLVEKKIIATAQDENVVVFDGNGASGTMAMQVVQKDTDAQLNANTFSRTDYEFNGWNTSQDGNGTSYSDGDTINISSDTTLYAQWSPVHAITVTDDGNGTGNTSPAAAPSNSSQSNSSPSEDSSSDTNDDSPSNDNDSSANDNSRDYLDDLMEKLEAAAFLGGKQTIYWNEGTALSYEIMKFLEDHPDITLIFSYTYLGKDYKVTIPGSKVKTNILIPWYGPVYLFENYGMYGLTASAPVDNTTSGTYTVKSGDTLSRIATRLKTTVKDLVQENNITNPNFIRPGQVFKY